MERQLDVAGLTSAWNPVPQLPVIGLRQSEGEIVYLFTFFTSAE